VQTDGIGTNDSNSVRHLAIVLSNSSVRLS
jgi:hypothetical protein